MKPDLLRRRSSPKAQRTRQQILDSSLELFKDRGFDASSMRDIAARAGLSLGSAYYYFGSKEELVFAFYERTQVAAEERSREMVRRTTSFADRLRDVLLFELAQLAEYRPFIVVLARTALDPGRPLSPFSPQTRPIRDGAIEILRQVVEGSDLEVHRKLRPHLPRLLWLYQMGIIFFWIHDESPSQARTRRVIAASLALLTKLLSLTSARLPGVGKAVALAVELLEEVAFWDASGAPERAP